VSAGELRDAIGCFATGVTIVTSVGAGGEPVGTTASAVSSLSLEPPLVLVCLDRSSQTLSAIRGHRAFAVNVLAADQHEISTNFARRGRAATWESVSHRHGSTGSPRLDGVLAVLDCAVERVVAAGDHDVVIGRVHEITTSDEDLAPLLHYRGAYSRIGS
jgi:flavin reductase (DIM6/NTAB) family NADH-FMN oxidoreductase RutF